MKRESIARLSEARILVIGDWMTDVWVDGVVERISPEAPVPVFRETGRFECEGGAGNMAANVVALGAKAIKLFDGYYCEVKRPTIKTRYHVNGHQLFRVDSEETAPISDKVEASVIADMRHSARECDIIAISDYGKGVVTRNVVVAAVGTGKPVVVDPAITARASLYEGASVIKPNRRELQRLVDGREDDLPNPEYLSFKTKAHVVCTLGDGGIRLVDRERTRSGRKGHVVIPAHPVPVADVTGAGDTAMAALCASLAVGLDLYEAAEIANLAASIAVSKRGTAAVSAEELMKAFERL